MDFEAQREQRQKALEEKRKRLEVMRKGRQERAAGAGRADSPVKASKAETDDLVNSIMANSAAYGGGAAKSSANFSVVKSEPVDIFPLAKMTYTKETQTDGVDKSELLSLSVDEEEEEENHAAGMTPYKGRGAKEATTPAPQTETKVVKKKTLTEEEYQETVALPEFQEFLTESVTYMERALEQADKYDILRNYAVERQNIKTDSSAFSCKQLVPYEDRTLEGRPIHDVMWSPHVNELFVIAYGSKPPVREDKRGGPAAVVSVDDDIPGLVCVWSKELQKRPEFKFASSSPVLVTIFHNTESNLVLGGCYNGQILLWDMKAKALPVQRSSMSGRGHRHPIYAMSMVSLTVSNELVSVSTDGMLCHWDITRLAEPLTVTHLHFPSAGLNTSMPIYGDRPTESIESLLSPEAKQSTSDANSGVPLNICSMAFAQSDSATHILFGGGAGQVFRSALPYRPKDPPINELNAHYGMITNIQPHNSQNKHHKNLLLTASLDWTVKLWNLNNLSKPVLEFFTPSYDYVCDAKWSPINPSVFCTITSGGKLSMWNLSKSTTEPVDTISIIRQLEGAGAEPAGGSKKMGGLSSGAGHTVALNKMVWSTDGMSIVVGDSSGVVHFVTVQPNFASINPADEGRFEQFLQSHNDQDGRRGGLTPAGIARKSSFTTPGPKERLQFEGSAAAGNV